MIVAAATVPGAPLLLPGVTGGPVREVGKAREAMAAAVTVLLDQGAEEIIVVGGAPATRPFPADAPGPERRLAPFPAHPESSVSGERSASYRQGSLSGRGERPGFSSGRDLQRSSSGRDERSASSSRGDGSVLPVSLAVGRSLLEACPVAWSLYGVGGQESPERCRAVGRELAAGERPCGLLVVADGSARRSEKAPGHFDPYAIELDARIGAALAEADTGALLGLEPADCERVLAAGRAAWQVMAAACEDRPWQARTLYEEDPFGVAYWVTTWT